MIEHLDMISMTVGACIMLGIIVTACTIAALIVLPLTLDFRRGPKPPSPPQQP